MPNNFRSLLCAITLLIAAGCAAQSVRTEGYGSLDPSDVVKRSEEEGCQLIPYASRRETCIRENDGLHTAAACNAQACAAGAGYAANSRRRDAWASCVARRTAINGAFAGTVKDLKEFQRSPQWKGWRQDWKAAEKLIISKIEAGTKTHQDQLRAAEQNLTRCKALAPPETQ